MKKKLLPLAILAARTEDYYERLEREHLGCSNSGAGIYSLELKPSLIYPYYHDVKFLPSDVGTEAQDFNIYLSPMEAASGSN